MFDGKRCHRDALLAVVVALVVAMADAFGVASASVAADPAEKPVTSGAKTTLKGDWC